MINQIKTFWETFKSEKQKGQIILVLIVVIVATNWYHYQTVLDWMQRNDDQTKKIDELQRANNSDIVRFTALISDTQAKADACQEERIEEHKARIKKDSVFYAQTDNLYQKINEILTLKSTE